MCNLTIYSLKVRMPWKCIHQHINAMMSGRGCVQCGQTFYRFKLYYVFDYFLGTIHILRNHIFRIFGPPPPPPYVSMFLVLKIIKNRHFLTPPPPLQVTK